MLKGIMNSYFNQASQNVPWLFLVFMNGEHVCILQTSALSVKANTFSFAFVVEMYTTKPGI